MAVTMETPEVRGALARFWQRLQSVQSRIDEAVDQASRRVPAFRAVLERIEPTKLRAQRERSLRLQRAALLDGEWAEYLSDL
jgi:hypothetical protein